MSKKTAAAAKAPEHIYSTLIVGAGYSGICNAIRLREGGIDNIVLLERAGEVGGTWRDTRYPGAACDVPSNLYSLSFAPNPAWSRAFPTSGEIQQHIVKISHDYHLRPLIRFNTNVTGMVFNEEDGTWTVNTTGGGTYRARTVVMASGPLANASFPKIDGIERYEGHKIHSAYWDEQYDFRGKRVAVIGTGASAVQIVPELVKTAQHVKVFQRTPGWMMPRPDYEVPEWNRSLFRRLPTAQNIARDAVFWIYESSASGVVFTSPVTAALERVAKAHLHAQVKDRWLRRQLTPDYRIGCKRILLSSEYYPALQQPNCELVTWPIAGLCEEGVRTCDGLTHRFDAIVFATGYDVAKDGSHLAFPVTGLGGRSLAQDWARYCQAYKATTVSGYPNLFMMLGPNAGPGHNSALVYMEAQVGYTVQAVRAILRGKYRYADVKPEVQRAFNVDIQRRLQKTNWNTGCKSWYINEDGFNPSMFPGYAKQFEAQMKSFEPADYSLVR